TIQADPPAVQTSAGLGARNARAESALDFPQIMHTPPQGSPTLNLRFKSNPIHRVGMTRNPGQRKKETDTADLSTELSTGLLHRHSGVVRTLSTELSTGTLACPRGLLIR